MSKSQSLEHVDDDDSIDPDVDVNVDVEIGMRVSEENNPNSDSDSDSDSDSETEEFIPSPEQYMRIRILLTLMVYPRVSPSMLQAALGPHNKPAFWRPILEGLIREGYVSRTQEPHRNEQGRYKISTIIFISEDKRTFIADQLGYEILDDGNSAIAQSEPDHGYGFPTPSPGP